MSPTGWTADLVTICRTFHWLDRPLVLERLDQVVATHGVVAVLGDNSIWADNARRKSELKMILAEFLGEARRAGSGTYQRPTPYTDELEGSAFSTWEQLRVPVRRERSLDSVIGYLHSTSFAAPHLFGEPPRGVRRRNPRPSTPPVRERCVRRRQRVRDPPRAASRVAGRRQATVRVSCPRPRSTRSDRCG